MAVIRLMAAAALPSPEDAARLLAGHTPSPGGGGQAPTSGPPPAGPDQPSAQTDSPRPEEGSDAPQGASPGGPDSMSALIAMIEAERDLALKTDVERYVRPVSVGAGKLVYEAADGAPGNLGARLSGFLQDRTGERWLVDGKGDARGGETLAERRRREAREAEERARRDPVMVRAMTLFPGAEIVGFEEPAPPADPEHAETHNDSRKEGRR